MTIIVEDGTGKPDAESYASVADLRTYCDNFGYAAIAALSDARLEVLLRQATQYMLGQYSAAWQGERAVPGQRLDWPRTGVVAYGQDVPSNIVPDDVRDACSLLATKAQAGPLNPQGGQTVKRVKVGPLEKEYDNEYGNNSAQPRYFDVGALAVPYLVSSNPYSVKLVRA